MVKIDPDEVYALGQDTITFANTYLSDTAPLSEVVLNDATWGEFHISAEFVLVHGTAEKVVKSTLKGVHDDLVTFGGGLQKAVATLREAEDDSVRVFEAFGIFMPGMTADPETALDSDALNDIADIEAPSEADTSRADALAEGPDGGDSA